MGHVLFEHPELAIGRRRVLQMGIAAICLWQTSAFPGSYQAKVRTMLPVAALMLSLT